MESALLIPANTQEFLLTIDSNDGSVSGSLYHCFYAEAMPFSNLFELTLLVEDTLSLGDSSKQLAFSAGNTVKVQSDVLATFKLDVLFRQHNSWQGRLTWIERNTEITFRSYLELILTMAELLSQEKANKKTGEQ